MTRHTSGKTESIQKKRGLSFTSDALAIDEKGRRLPRENRRLAHQQAIRQKNRKCTGLSTYFGRSSLSNSRIEDFLAQPQHLRRGLHILITGNIFQSSFEG